MKTDEEFIERIKNFEIIYDKKNINYSNINEREKIWLKLSKEFNCDAKKKWVRLRDKYVRLKRRTMKASASDEESEFHAMMSFIDNHIKPRRKPAVKTEEIFDEPEIEDVRSFYNEFCTEITTPNCSENVHSENNTSDSSGDEQTKSKRRKTDSVQQDFMETLKVFQEKIQKIKRPEENDEDMCFMRLITFKMKKMSSTKKSTFQLEILKKADEMILKND